MFVPTIGLLMVGRQLDTRFSTKPFLMVTGIVLGSLIAAYLVKAQIQRGGVTK
jgi:F0F1-type ATP synthase assembly protein I